jgi:hypothetical protein
MEKKMDYVPLWLRYLPMFEKSKVSDARLGALVRAMMEYQLRGTEPVDLDEGLSVFWMFIREDLDRAQLKYDTAVENGKKGGRPKKRPEKPKETPDTPAKPRTTTKTTTKTTSTTSSTSTSKTETTSPDNACGEALSVCKQAYGEFGWVCLTGEQYQDLEALMGAQELARCIAYIDRSAQSTNNRNQWQDWSLILRRCYEGRWHDTGRTVEPIPKGASGVFGPAELEAIQRVLQTGS